MSNLTKDHHLWTRDTVKNVSGDVTLDIDGDIILDTDGNQIKFQADGAARCELNFATLNTVKLLTDTNLHLNLVSQGTGDVVLDSGGGSITLKDGGSTYTPSAISDATTKAYVDTGDNAQYHFIKCGFYSSSSAQIFIPIAGSDDLREATNPTGSPERFCMICPFDGSVETVWARSEEDCGSTIIGFHLSTGAGSEVPSGTATQTVTVDMGTDDTSYEFDFASAGTNTFSQGDIVAFSVDPTSVINDVHFMIVLKYDVST